MKYIVNLTSAIETVLSDGNFRGEPRWERNVVDALIQSGRDIHTTQRVWRSPLPKPANFHDGVCEDWLSDSVLITHGIMRNPHISVNAKHYVVQYHEPPDEEHKHLFLNYHDKNPGCIIATTATQHSHVMSRLCSVLGEDKVEWIQGPSIPFVDETANNFRKPLLLWVHRNFPTMAEERPDEMRGLFEMLVDFLVKEPELRIAIVVGLWHEGMVKELTAKAAKEWVFSNTFMDVVPQDRCDVYINIGTREVLSLLKETRYVISPAEPLGPSPYEAAMYGIPMIVADEVSPFWDGNGEPLFKGILSAPERSMGQDFLDHLDRLQNDFEWYTTHSNAYRTYVKEYGTYEAYIRQLDAVFRKRGWVS